MVLAKMDEIGRPAWIAAVVLGFWLFWPVGLAMLGYLAWTGRLAAMRRAAPGQWHNVRERFTSATGFAMSGNQAFDAYRAETLRRLEDEQQEFVAYLERLRRARDKSEFDQFMADRGNRTTDVNTTEQA